MNRKVHRDSRNRWVLRAVGAFGLAAFVSPVGGAENTRVIQIAAGQTHSQAVCEQNTILGSGANDMGQLGDGTFVDAWIPTKALVKGMESVTATSGHVLAIDSKGKLWGWGNNVVGQLGSGDWSFSEATPVPAQGPGGAIGVAAGHDHSMALRSDGTVWTMGLNWIGQLGLPLSITYAPERVPYLEDVVAIAAGWYHSMAITSDGSLWAWGANTSGQLGIGTTTWGEWEPVRVDGITQVLAIAADTSHSLAVTADGSVWAWGRNDHGQLGDGSTETRNSPVRVTGVEGAIAVSAGEDHSAVLLDDGTVWAWGRNNRGQLGNGTFEDSSIPVRVLGLTKIESIATGAWHNLALDHLGIVWGWGENRNGELGSRDSERSNVPLRTLFREVCKDEG